jgi:glycogen phosphorylase
MVREYAEKLYLPAHFQHRRLLADGAKRAAILADSLYRIQNAWAQVRILELAPRQIAEILSGESIRFQVRIQIGPLAPEDIKVELYAGRLNADGEIIEPVIAEMKSVRCEKNECLFEVASVPCCGSGHYGYTVRVLPQHPDLKDPFATGLITWADGEAAGMAQQISAR